MSREVRLPGLGAHSQNYDNNVPLPGGAHALPGLLDQQLAGRQDRAAPPVRRPRAIGKTSARGDPRGAAAPALRLTQSGTTALQPELARRSLALERERYQLGLSLLQVQSAEAVWRQAENEDLAQRLAFRDRLAELELARARR